MVSLRYFLANKYLHNDNKYNPMVRAQDILDVIYTIKGDGLKVICHNNKLYIENTVSGEKILIHFYENGRIKRDLINF